MLCDVDLAYELVDEFDVPHDFSAVLWDLQVFAVIVHEAFFKARLVIIMCILYGAVVQGALKAQVPEILAACCSASSRCIRRLLCTQRSMLNRQRMALPEPNSLRC